MWSILADLFIGFFEFVIDVMLFRGLRRKHGRRNRHVAEDALEVARFDFVTVFLIALVCFGLMLLLALGLQLSAVWSVGIGIAVAVVWGVWRYFRLLHKR